MSENIEVSQDILDEALNPESSEDFFHFEGKKIQLKPLKIKYQKQWVKVFAPVAESIALSLAGNQQAMVIDDDGRAAYKPKGFADFSVTDWLLISSALMEQADILPRLVQILCQNDGQMVTDEELEESSLQPEAMQEIILKHCKKAGSIERQVADFFQHVLPIVRGKLDEALKSAKEKIVNESDKASSTTTV